MCPDFLFHIVQPKQQCNILNAEADTKIQLSSTKAEIKPTCKKCKTMTLFPLNAFALENIVILQKNMVLMLSCNALTGLF